MLIGSSAFSTVEADRDVTVDVVGDDDGYLRIAYGDLTVSVGEETVPIIELTNRFPVRLEDIAVSVTTAETLSISAIERETPLEPDAHTTVSAILEDDPDCGTTTTVQFEIDATGADGGIETVSPREFDLTVEC